MTDPVTAHQIAAHTQAVLDGMARAPTADEVVSSLIEYRKYAKAMRVASQIQDHVEGAANRRIIHIKALAKNGQITSPRSTGQSAGYTDRMLGEGEE